MMSRIFLILLALTAAAAARAAEQPPAPGAVIRDCAQCPELVVIAAGTFVMGAPDNELSRSNDEGPAHSVHIAAPFAIGRFEVTRNEFEEFVDETGYDAGRACRVRVGKDYVLKPELSFRSPGFAQTGSDPVTCVDFSAAKAYTAWLTRKTGKAYRLPSEAEWEFAARGGTAGLFPFPGGYADVCAYGNIADQTLKRELPEQPIADCSDGQLNTAPVGSFRPNTFGLYDMIGNVREWVEDCWHKRYDGAPSDGSAWIDGGDCRNRALRGGSWFSEPWYVRSANRYWGWAAFASNYNGFRVVRSLGP